MKPIRHTLCFAALAFAFGMPALASNDALSDSKAQAAALAQERAAPSGEGSSSSILDDLPEQATFEILLAEIALRQGDLELACQIYARLALLTRDPQVLERAVEVAGYARRLDLAMDIARLWLDVDPTSQKAQRMLVGILILNNQTDELAPYLVRMLESDANALPDNLLGLNRMFARNTDRVAVFRLIDQVCRPFFGIAEAHYAVAVAASSAGVGERASQEVQKALELRPDWEQAAFLKAQLLLRTSKEEAIGFMEKFLEKTPDSREVKLLLARTMASERRYADAKRYFDELLKIAPDSPEIVYSSAILALQQDDKAQAEAQLKHFVTLKVPNKASAYYYLGQIAEEDKRADEALGYYAQVLSGEYYLPAQMRSARLLGQQGHMDRAFDLLRNTKADNAEDRVKLIIAEASLLREAKRDQEALVLLEKRLAEQPEQPELMYESALLAEKLDKMELAETRLRRLIELRPDNPQAYNALGYSYADRNVRLAEARELIEKALALAPDDGFILDSMGWVLFRQGDLPGALSHLERAYAKRGDPEIAAHIGEVLWAQDRKDEARKILFEAQKKYPDNETLSATIRKLEL